MTFLVMKCLDCIMFKDSLPIGSLLGDILMVLQSYLEGKKWAILLGVCSLSRSYTNDIINRELRSIAF
jgi:hypothetical protein